jgi:hypothetical protein
MPTYAIFQLYRGVNNFIAKIKNLSYNIKGNITELLMNTIGAKLSDVCCPVYALWFTC